MKQITGGNIRLGNADAAIRAAAAPGDVVEAGAELFSVADLSTVYVQAQVYEKDLGQVRAGQTASIAVDAYPSHTLASTSVAEWFRSVI